MSANSLQFSPRSSVDVDPMSIQNKILEDPVFSHDIAVLSRDPSLNAVPTPSQPTDDLNMIVSDDDNSISDEETPLTDNSKPNLSDVDLKLQEQRAEIFKIEGECYRNRKAGDKYYYIDPEWITKFMQALSVDEIPLLVSEEPLSLNHSNYYHENVFSKLTQWYGLAYNPWPIARFLIEKEGNYELDLLSFLVSPHIVGIDIEQEQMINDLNIGNLVFDGYVRPDKIYQKFKKVFDLDLSASDFQIWLLNDDYLQDIPVVLPLSMLSKLDKRVLIHPMGRNNRFALRRGHYIVEVKQQDGSFLLNNVNLIQKSTGTLGLQNLGNTCYMNSALQCLVHIPELTDYFLSNYYQRDINENNPLGYGGTVANSFGDLISLLFDSRRTFNHSSTNPKDFKYTIGRHNRSFAGYAQQDSQEFIAFLLDALHEDLNRIVKKPYVEKPELSPGQYKNPDAIRDLAKQCWDAHKLRNDSVVLDLFGALYKSTLICPECNHVSITFDPYNDLTLPLPIIKNWSHKIYLVSDGHYTRSLEVELPQTSSYLDLKQYISRITGIPVSELIGTEIFRCRFVKFYENPESGSQYLPLPQLIDTRDTVMFYQLKYNPDDIIIPVVNKVQSNSTQSDTVIATPFLISLSTEEVNDYGTIIRKIFENVKKLSTAPILSKLSEDSIQYTVDDFSDISQFFDYYGLDKFVNNINAYIGFSNPKHAVDEFFDVQILPPKFSYMTQSTNMLDASEKLTFNFNLGDIFNHQNENLISSLCPISKIFYWYDQRRRSQIQSALQIREKEKAKIDEYESGSEEEIGHIEKPEDSEYFRNDENMIDHPVIVENPDKPEMVQYFETRQMNDFEKIDGCDNERGSESEHEMKNMMESESENYDEDNDENSDSDIESNSETNESFVKLQGSNLPGKLSNPIVLGNSLVLNWKNDYYMSFFCDMGDDDEFCGNDATINATAIKNEELEQKRIESKMRSKTEVSLGDCLDLFSQNELLGSNDLWRCPICKDERQATKKIELWSTPDILIVHLKRFSSQGTNKISDVIKSPFFGLDLGNYIAPESDNESVNAVYDLFAVDCHSGSLNGGHYTAFVKNFVDKKWHYFNDSHVSEAGDIENIIDGRAYLLLYRKRNTKVLGGEKIELMYQDIQHERDTFTETLENARKERYNELLEKRASQQKEKENAEIEFKTDEREREREVEDSVHSDEYGPRKNCRLSASTGDIESLSESGYQTFLSEPEALKLPGLLYTSSMENLPMVSSARGSECSSPCEMDGEIQKKRKFEYYPAGNSRLNLISRNDTDGALDNKDNEKNEDAGDDDLMEAD